MHPAYWGSSQLRATGQLRTAAEARRFHRRLQAGASTNYWDLNDVVGTPSKTIRGGYLYRSLISSQGGGRQYPLDAVYQTWRRLHAARWQPPLAQFTPPTSSSPTLRPWDLRMVSAAAVATRKASVPIHYATDPKGSRRTRFTPQTGFMATAAHSIATYGRFYGGCRDQHADLPAPVWGQLVDSTPTPRVARRNGDANSSWPCRNLGSG
jgi:hypothetical protein